MGTAQRLDLGTLDRICHETRRPLSVIHAHIELLADEIPGPLTAEQRESIAVVLTQLGLLGRAVGDVYTTFEALAGETRVTLVAADLGELLGALLDEYEPRCAASSVRLSREIAPAPGLLDTELTTSALRAVLDNAFQYGAGAGEITVRLVPREGGAEVFVMDGGPGIAADERELVFESFYRGRLGQQVSAKGLGLGLTRCRALMRVLGGGVRWIERPDGETGIVVDIPLRKQREPGDGF